MPMSLDRVNRCLVISTRFLNKINDSQLASLLHNVGQRFRFRIQLFSVKTVNHAKIILLAFQLGTHAAICIGLEDWSMQRINRRIEKLENNRMHYIHYFKRSDISYAKHNYLAVQQSLNLARNFAKSSRP